MVNRRFWGLLAFILIGIFLVNFGEAYLCYQESANTTNQTGIDGNCGLNYGGSYDYSGDYSVGYPSWTNSSNFFDGDWSTFTQKAGSALSAFFLVNYSIPSNITGAIWQVKDWFDGSTKNYSLPSECFSSPLLQLRFQKYNVNLAVWTNLSCYNGTGYTLLQSTSSSGINLYEEAIYWNLSYVPIYSCQVLDQSSTVYSLKNDVFSGSICFNITADNVTLEGNGRAINGSFGNSDTFAVYSKSARNISIRNLTIDSFADDTYCTNCGAINFTNVSYSLISNIVLNNNAHGIRLRDSTYNLLRNINFSFSNPGSGISAVWIKSSNHNYLNNLTSNGEISFDNSVNNTMYSCYIYGDSLFSGERNSTIKNTLFSGGSIGISDSDYVPSGNLFENNTVYAPAGFESIIISTGGFIRNNTFLNNNLYSNAQSIFLFDNSNPQINPLIYNNSFGQISWTNTSTLYNNNYGIMGNITFPGTIQISNLSAYVNSSALPELNVSANITLYNIPTNIVLPRIMKDGVICVNCYNFTPLNSGNVTFNVSSWSNYTIQDASQLSACGTLSIANTVYTLQNDVSTTGTCFSITADNITLNLNGHNITGGNNAGYFGVSSSNRRNITVLNGLVEWFGKSSGGSFGVYFSNTSNSNISNVIFSNNFNGLYLLGASNNNTVQNITSNFNNYSGVYLIASLNNRLYNITTLNNNYGVDLESSSNNNSFFNVISANNQNEGITLSSSSNNNFSYINAYNNSASVYFATSSNNLFSEANISNSSWGVYLSLVSNNNLFYNLNSYSNTNQEILVSISTGSQLRYNNSFGQIRLNSLTSNVEGDLRFGLGRNIQIAMGSAYLNSSALPGLNLSANITLNNTGYIYPKIMKDGVACSNCVLLSSSETNHTFNVTSWSNYTIVDNTDLTTCRNLNSANSIYTLQNNLFNVKSCFNITANNITLNLNGYTVDGKSVGTGINLSNVNYSFVENGTVTDFGIGIFSESSFYSNFSNLYLSSLVQYGLVINNSAYSRIINVSSSGTSPSPTNVGFIFNNVNYSFVENGTVTDFGMGIFSESSFYSNFSNLYLDSFTQCGLAINDSAYYRIINVSSSGTFPSSTNVGFIFNNVNYSSGYGDTLSAAVGLSMQNSFYNIFERESISTFYGSGISLTTSAHNVFVEETIDSYVSSPSAYLVSSLNNTFIDSLFRRGINLVNSDISLENSSTGKVSFYSSPSLSFIPGSNIFSDYFKIFRGLVYNNLSVTNFNLSANITFYNLPIKVSEMYNASVLFNEGNGKMSCANCNLLNSSDSDSSVTFNVSDFGNSRNYSVGGVDVVSLNPGWNSVSFIMDGLTNSSKNISVSAGWNLIGFSSNSIVNSTLINFTNNSGNRYTWDNAVVSGKVMNDLFVYNSSSKTFEVYNNLTKGKGYWVYAREAGNITIPPISGTNMLENYSLTDLMFANSFGDEKNITDANDLGWINISRIYGYSSSTNFTALNYQLNFSNSWKGYVFWSNQNLSLLRQD